MHFKNNALKEVLGGKDFRVHVKVSLKIADVALFLNLGYVLFYEAFIG